MTQLFWRRFLQQGVGFLQKRPFWRYTLILTLFLAFAVTVAASNDSTTPYLVADTYYPHKSTRYVSSWRLKMRYGPSTGYAVMTKLKHDDSFQVIGHTAASDWLLIELHGGQQGWVWKEYTTIHPHAAAQKLQPKPVEQRSHYQGSVTSYRLNLREGPSTDYKTILKLEHQESMNIVGRNEEGTWLYVRTAYGLEGWVWSEHVRIGVATK